ncbi:MAG: PLP-dependent aminotransferase family protein [Acidobacteria bacterium]|nr:PLP-dependent aminotransferase family protein [Acidobacteriota bacterium]
MIPLPALDEQSETPLYRQLFDAIRVAIRDGVLPPGHRLPPTRELAGSLSLNRTTVSAAYELLDQAGLIRSHVGRGSFVAEPSSSPISFATSRPLDDLFPLDEFRATVREVMADASIAAILQLGAPHGYAPLRRYLGANETEDVLVTNGCQQALDLIQRVLAPLGTAVMVEDPTYPGLKNVFERGGVRLIPLPRWEPGARLAIVTPNFQNPTGHTMSLSERHQLLRDAREQGVTLIEIDIYSALRYQGEALPSLAELDDTGSVLQIGSFSKVSFPGLRIGWVKGRRDLIARLAEAKQWTDLHTDQLSQAIVLRFAESGRLETHRQRVIATGQEQLAAVATALEREMPPGTTFTRPDGGMNLWVRLPAQLDAAALLPEAQRVGVNYLPARYFAVSRPEPGAFRLSFGGLTPERISAGVALLGEVFRRESPDVHPELLTAMV